MKIQFLDLFRQGFINVAFEKLCSCLAIKENRFDVRMPLEKRDEIVGLLIFNIAIKASLPMAAGQDVPQSYVPLAKKLTSLLIV